MTKTILGAINKEIKVEVNNKDFENCRFENCVLQYSGLGLVGFKDCHFSNVEWYLLGLQIMLCTF